MSGIDNEIDALFDMNSPDDVFEHPAAPTADVIKPAEFVRQAHPQWDRCKVWIQAALEGDHLTPQDVENQIRDGKAMLWPGKECAVVTEIVSYPNGDKVLQPMAAGGDLEEIEAMIPGIEAYGRVQGCATVRIEGRKGWERRMKSFGYAFHSVIIRKAL
jgi:hypothetical protein